MDPDTACKTALERGLNGIAFVDHLDYDFPGYDNILINFGHYIEYFRELSNKYSSKLTVLKGVEVGIQPHVVNESLNTVKQFDFDYVLASVHILDGLDPYMPGYYDDKTKLQAYGRYLEYVLHMVTHFNCFDVVGHIDYIIRRACYDDRILRYHEHTDLLDMILKQLVSNGKGMEINTGSYKESDNGKQSAEFDMNILKRYKELGGEIVCLGSDSHQPEQLGYKFEYYRQMLIDAGFRYTTYFKDRKPHFVSVEG